MVILTVCIFVTYIGLGIPDSSVGASWPAIFPDLEVQVGYQSFITFLTSLSTVTASFFSAKLINKFGTGIVVAFSTLLTSFGLLWFSMSPNFWLLLISTLPLGFGAGAIDAALNNFAATHFKSFKMNVLHCFYGIGVAITPYVFSFALARNNDWRLGYRIIFYIQLLISAICFLDLPLWKKIAREDKQTSDYTPTTLTVKQLLSTPAVKVAWLTFFMTCSLEFACDCWATSYLVNSEGLSESLGAKFTTVYFLGMTTGRFTSGLLSTKIKLSTITQIGYTLIGIAIISLYLPIPAEVKGLMLFLIGLGNGPTFPNLTYITPRRYGKNLSQSIVSSQMVAANLGVMLSPVIFGILAQKLTVRIFPYYVSILFVCMVIATIVYDKKLKKAYGEGI